MGNVTEQFTDRQGVRMRSFVATSFIVVLSVVIGIAERKGDSLVCCVFIHNSITCVLVFMKSLLGPPYPYSYSCRWMSGESTWADVLALQRERLMRMSSA